MTVAGEIAGMMVLGSVFVLYVLYERYRGI